MLRRLSAALIVAAGITAAPAHAAPDPVALRILDALPVHDPAPMTGYSRDQFGAAWTDNNDDELGRNHCDTRDDILARDLTGVVRQGNCTVISGTLIDPYTARVIHFQRGPDSSAVQIDHIVALGNAWITGAQQLPAQRRIDLANDPHNLLAVDGQANNAKRDKDASQWLPPNTSFRCTYVADQILVKTAYHLWITVAEKRAMTTILNQCP
ncbi:HNH endonuclease family protein [Mycobacterium palustre]|uniref:GmrSD restriction endonucleases C-terminal domain-containing protein n=1 Tax=Mycobacterium palustre TaxID=153971 RepID=A0A1X1ZTM5_9MYCO|nr:HNH endonuclease family protein [Mycobacterium palustre]MCV7100964.1 HNH endonuclease [Mycobacterium palustre]ORW27037.1 hypothetical protein AWC19_03170 [Mycobacterium palustre]